tara:strand:- start:642 stop:1103 length:462 start_codon:yes stop_codon:yes gene_type:complete
MSDKKIANLLEWRENVPEGRLLNPGLAPFDVMEAPEWSVISSSAGQLELLCHLPDVVLNPAGQLFGGFTAAYVDIASLYAAQSDVEGTPGFQSTINMRLDYFEAITKTPFRVTSEVIHCRGETRLVACNMFQDDVLAVYGLTTMRHQPLSEVL